MLAERKGSINVSGKKDFIKNAFMMICICCNQGFLTVFNMGRFIFVPQSELLPTTRPSSRA